MQNEILKNAGEQIGSNAKFSLLRETGRLKDKTASTADDVVGFDYLVSDGSTCYAFYAANPPLEGLTKPTQTTCPVGIAVFDDYKIDYKEAVNIFHTGNWGSEFTAISISKPLTPEVTDPLWRIMSSMGTEVVINANTGEVEQPGK